MSTVLTASGISVLAEAVAKGNVIDGIYVEFGGSAAASAERNAVYFNNLASIPGHGYARVHITHAYSEGDIVKFTALVTAEDFTSAPPDDAYINCVSLAKMDPVSNANDVIICTSDLEAPVKLVKGAYISINTALKIG